MESEETDYNNVDGQNPDVGDEPDWDRIGRVAREYYDTDSDGKIVPTDEAFRQVNVDYADKSDAEKWRLAQAVTLIDAFERAHGRRSG